ncbi:MAG: hypothetical protein Q7V05_16900, partial [Methanoregula sp.]|nr:hypothetical protein [Methanoregula sp.]
YFQKPGFQIPFFENIFGFSSFAKNQISPFQAYFGKRNPFLKKRGSLMSYPGARRGNGKRRPPVQMEAHRYRDPE